jgi:hypothetical protein
MEDGEVSVDGGAGQVLADTAQSLRILICWTRQKELRSDSTLVAALRNAREGIGLITVGDVRRYVVTPQQRPSEDDARLWKNVADA